MDRLPIRLRQHQPGDLVPYVAMTCPRRWAFRGGPWCVREKPTGGCPRSAPHPGLSQSRWSCERSPHQHGPDNGQSDGDRDPNWSTGTPAGGTEQQLRSPAEVAATDLPHSLGSAPDSAAAYPSSNCQDLAPGLRTPQSSTNGVATPLSERSPPPSRKCRGSRTGIIKWRRRQGCMQMMA